MHVHMDFEGAPVSITTDEVVRDSRYVFRVTWCSRWDLIDALANAGRLIRVHYGANTYGHCEYFYP